LKKLAIYTFLTLFVIGLGVGSWVYHSLYSTNTEHNSPVTIYIPSNASFESVLDTLRPILINETGFTFIAKKRNYPNNIKPGKYVIPVGASNMELITQLRSGQQETIAVTFNNVHTVADVCGKVAPQLELDSTSLYNSIFDADFLAEKQLTKDQVKCILLPNTYDFYWAVSPKKFRDRMYSEYQRFWNASRLEAANSKNMTPLEVHTLASIVVRETAKREEMATVAGLYLNRLDRNIRLQSDPTVIYAIAKETGRDPKIRRVLYKDLEIDSPYNTYKVSGLPPAPISIPDGKAIDAVLHAEKHNYIFMCADPDRPGFHSFAKNEMQHSANKRKYVNWLQSQNIKR
jgi:UPF0755 protein